MIKGKRGRGKGEERESEGSLLFGCKIYYLKNLNKLVSPTGKRGEPNRFLTIKN